MDSVIASEEIIRKYVGSKEKYIPVMHQAIVGITCDRCQSFYSAKTPKFDAFISIRYSCGFGTVWYDGQTIEVDLLSQGKRKIEHRGAQANGD